MSSVRSFQVTLMVTGTVLADNAGDAVSELSEQVRTGLGPDTGRRKNAATIAHAEATCKSVFIPERSKGDHPPESAETS